MFFFFKQKTAYEMRISDWSSDVCSSDLPFDQFCRVLKRRYLTLGTSSGNVTVSPRAAASISAFDNCPTGSPDGFICSCVVSKVQLSKLPSGSYSLVPQISTMRGLCRE